MRRRSLHEGCKRGAGQEGLEGLKGSKWMQGCLRAANAALSRGKQEGSAGRRAIGRLVALSRRLAMIVLGERQAA